MPRFNVNLSRTTYTNIDIEIDADSEEEALKTAEENAGNYAFPTEHTATYEAVGVTLIKEESRTP